MHLKSVRIQNFRSIVGPVELIVDRHITVLVGANDHGKSNVLRAIQACNEVTPIASDEVNWDAPEGSMAELVWNYELTMQEREQLADARTLEVSAADANSSHVESVTVSITEALEVPAQVSMRRTSKDRLVVDEAHGFDSSQQELLLSMRPRFELFTPNDAITNEVSLDQIQTEQFEFMKGIFIKAGIWDRREKAFVENTQSSRMLDDASNRLTSTLNNEWEQGRGLTWKLKTTSGGAKIRLEILDPSVASRNVLPSQRSSGFTAFFLLSLTLFARTNGQDAKNFVYLFDEPGTYLHPVAQINLQRVFESLSESNQILYTTHSVFLVNKNEPLRNRVVRKDESGTQIDKKPYQKNWKAIRDSLGILFTQNFFIADRTLLVEGPSDPIYLLASMLYLIRRADLDIDLNGFSIMDGGNETNYAAMAKIMLAEGRRIVCLVDNDAHGDKVMNGLDRLIQVPNEQSLLAKMKLPKGASIEDIVPHRKLLVKAAVDAVSQLVADGVVAFIQGQSHPTLLAKIESECNVTGSSETLGRRMIRAISECLVDGVQISKVNIAIRYEDYLSKCEDEPVDQPPALVAFIKSLREHMQLVSRRSEKVAAEK